MVRYFEAPAEDQKQTRFVCKRCGAESEHRTNECPVQIVRVTHHPHLNLIYECSDVVFDLRGAR
jgi:predicted RNA-binding Zn-ribbon protein involved in translation (DUF1610 family)